MEIHYYVTSQLQVNSLHTFSRVGANIQGLIRDTYLDVSKEKVLQYKATTLLMSTMIKNMIKSRVE